MEKWNYDINIFEDTDNDKVKYVIDDILNEMNRLIPQGPPLGFKEIRLINDHVAGPTLYWPLGKEFYKIGLNVSGLFYNQIAFQFCQELMRVYCDPRINNWLIEIIGHIGALYALEYLSEKWEIEPPIEELRDYWDNFDSYRSNLIGAAFSKVDMVKYQVSNEWVSYQINKLKMKDKLNRGKLLIIAYELLPLFKKYEEGWKIIPYIGKNSIPPPPEDSANLISNRRAIPDFESLANSIPDELHAFSKVLFDKIGVNQLI